MDQEFDNPFDRVEDTSFEWKDFDSSAEKFVRVFLKEYLVETFKGNSPDSRNGKNRTADVRKFYEKQIQYFKENKGNNCTFVINFDHMQEFKREEEEATSRLGYIISGNYLRIYDTLRTVVHEFLIPFVLDEKFDREPRYVWVGFCEFNSVKSLRELKTFSLGKLNCVTGTVTRTSEIQPELFIGNFCCNKCGRRMEGVKQRFVFTKPIKCINPQCEQHKESKDEYTLMLDDSELVNFQKVKIQENTDDIPSGTIPRSVDIVVRNDLVEVAKPGDKMHFFGTLIVLPDVSKIIKRKDLKGISKEDRGQQRRGEIGGIHEGITGLRVLGVRDLKYKLIFLCHYLERFGTGQFSKLSTSIWTEKMTMSDDNQAKGFLDTLDQRELQCIQKMKNDPQIVNNLVTSIAPQIYGYEDIKRGILLQMVGGVHKTTRESGIGLRGDINICIVGDPGCAKSQLLKYVSKVLPRAVYTSGKASSSAGLTASVVKNVDTGEFGIEAGALMLADNGICCIDEFDKMNVFDQVAIHEAMEQQTISIAKAGIRATLHARTAILAAANPIGGKYNNSKTLRANIGYSLSPAIISRFDLFFIICDKFDEDVDRKIAEHIVSVHKGVSTLKPKYSPSEIRLYIKYIQTQYQPIVTDEAIDLLVKSYSILRRRDKVQNHSYRITVRQLESLVRLSEALARIYCDTKVRKRHAQEALALLQKTQTKLDLPDIELDDDGEGDFEDYLTEIRKDDKEKRKDLFSRIRSNVTDYKTVVEDSENRLDHFKEEAQALEEKINELVQKKRKISIDQGNTEEISEEIELLKEKLSEKRGELEELQIKLDSSLENFEREKRREKELFDNLDEDLRNEIEKEDEDGEERSPKRQRKKKKKKKVKINQESYKKLSHFFTHHLNKAEREDENVKITVQMLVDKAVEEGLDNDIAFTEDVDQFKRLLLNLIKRLISVDNILIDLDIGVDDEFMFHQVIVNPNFSDE